MSGMISGALTRFKALLATTAGAAQMGYDAAVAYAAGTIGSAVNAASAAATAVGTALTNFVNSLAGNAGPGLIGYNDGNNYPPGTLGAIVKTLANPTQVVGVTSGSFVPEVSGSINAGIANYQVRNGFYWKVGPLTFIHINVTWTGHTGQGELNINMPVPPSYSGQGTGAMLQAKLQGYTPALNANDTMIYAVPYQPGAANSNGVLRLKSIVVGGGEHSYDVAPNGAVSITGWVSSGL